MDAWRDGAAGPFGGDAPEIAEAKGIWSRVREWGVVQVVAVFVEKFAEGVVIFSSEEFEQFPARFGYVHAVLRLFVEQALARCSVVGAEPRVRFHWRAVHVKGNHVRAHGPRFFVARIAIDAIERGVEVVFAKKPRVFEHHLDGCAACITDREAC